MIVSASLVAVAALDALHLFAGKLRFLDGTPRSVWLSAAGASPWPTSSSTSSLSSPRPRKRWSRRSRVAARSWRATSTWWPSWGSPPSTAWRGAPPPREGAGGGRGDATSEGVFWLHVSSLAVYNALIGYLLLHRETPGLQGHFLFSLAMALTFWSPTTGCASTTRVPTPASGGGCWPGPWSSGGPSASRAEISDIAVAVLIAFRAGGVVLNVLKEELPEERESRFWAFTLGAALYAGLLLAV